MTRHYHHHYHYGIKGAILNVVCIILSIELVAYYLWVIFTWVAVPLLVWGAVYYLSEPKPRPAVTPGVPAGAVGTSPARWSNRR